MVKPYTVAKTTRRVVIMELSNEEHDILIAWIKTNLYPRDSFNDAKTSYGIQRLFETAKGGFYVDNECIKAAMLECGFKPRSTSTLNWVFNISQKSPALKK
jgi:hypothetical protein